MRICSGAGCLRAVPDDVRFCDECRPHTRTSQTVQAESEIRDHTTGYDAGLDKLRKCGRWQLLRARVVREEPFCVRCGLRPTEIVDHIVPALVAVQQARDSGRYPMDRYAGYYLRTNLQGLCRPCHGIKTLEDKAHVGPWTSVLEKEDAKPKRKWFF